VGSLRFLVSRRWILFALTVVLLGYATWWLGEWQFHRLAHRQADNAVISRNLDRTPDDVSAALAPGRAVPDDQQWRHVSAGGTYDDEHTVVIRYQTRDGDSGVDVVTPLVTADGTAVLVDRGWLATDNSGARPDLPAPASGTVTVTGWVRQDGEGDSTKVTDASARAVSSVTIAPTLPYPTYGGWVALEREQPAPAQPLAPVEAPSLGNGPHFFYGLQWWFFGVLAVFGFCYLAYDEWRGGPGADRLHRRRRTTSPEDGPDDERSERAQHPAVDGEHHAGEVGSRG
jgi:cytochrome oxidase assembly protein ShyY1